MSPDHVRTGQGLMWLVRQVQGSNLGRLSRRLYRPLLYVAWPLKWLPAELRRAFARRSRAGRQATVSTL